MILRIAVLGVLVTLLGVPACTSNSATELTSPRSTSPTPSLIGSVTPRRPGGPPSIPPGLSTRSSLGHTVFITRRGFVPSILIAGIDAPVVFWNTTTNPQVIRFLNYGAPAGSAPIPAGGSWTFKPTHTASIVYESVAAPHRRGSLQIQLVQAIPTS